MAYNCNLKYRCVKCNKQLDLGNCKLSGSQQTDREEIYCVNCKKYGYPASYRGCQSLIDLKKSTREESVNNGKKRKENATTKLIYKKERKFRGNIKKQYQTG